MSKLYVLMLLGLCFITPAKAGLFADDDARKQIQQLEARFQALEASSKQYESAVKQQTKAMLDLQSQIEALNNEIRKLRGQNEEMAHGLQDAEKRQKDFYVDLDTRVRHLESAEEAAREAAEKAAKEAASASAVPSVAHPADLNDPVPENRAYEASYALFKAEDHANAIKAFREFIKKHPDSVHVPNANYWLGKSQLTLKQYKDALATYQGLLKEFPGMPREPEAMFDMAACQRALKSTSGAQKTLKKLVAKHPSSEAAAKAKKLLANTK